MHTAAFFGALASAIMASTFWLLRDLLGRIIRLQSKTVTLAQKDTDALKLGLIGTSTIAKFAVILPAAKSKRCIVRAVAGRSLTRAEEYAQANDIPVPHKSVDDLLQDPDIEAVYVSLPTEMHFEVGMQTIKAGKHLLMEKPMGLDAKELRELQEAAKREGVVIMEAMHYRYHPVTARLKELIESGELGQILSARVQFSKFDLAVFGIGGTKSDEQVAVKMFDRWIYCIDMLRFALSGNPTIIKAAKQERYHVSAEMEFENNVRGSFVADSRTVQLIPEWDLYVEGSRKRLFVKNFGMPFIYHRIEIQDQSGKTRTEKLYLEGQSTFEFQLEAFVDAIRSGSEIPTGARNAQENIDLAESIRKLF